MVNKSFHISTLRRGRYMLLLLAGVCVVTIIASRLPISEIAKILMVLFSLPLLIYCSTKWSKNDSVWMVQNGEIRIQFGNQQAESFPFANIERPQTVPRAGGNLLVFVFEKDKTPTGHERNNVETEADDLNDLGQARRQAGRDDYDV